MFLALVFLLADSAPQFRLPEGVVPRSHTIDLTLDPNNDSFTGLMTIQVDVQKPIREVWVNGRDLSVKRASIVFAGKRRTAKVRFHLDEFIGLESRSSIGPGPASLEIEYQAQLSNMAKSGPYRRETDGNWYAFTVFTPIDARRAFPCFDEPRFKTPWEVSIRVKAGDLAFANAPEVAREPQPDGGTLFRFARTQVIASEVVAFAVGPFDVYDGGSAGRRGTHVRVITPKGRALEGLAAAEATRHVLQRLEDYTGIPYPWDKLDHVALPEGAFGAVENPGLITYLSRALLLPPSSSEDRVRALQALEAHELAHQWFGNLVTQASWEDVWLSEGFATWFSSEVGDMDESPARAHLRLEARQTRIMDADDDTKRTHPVRQPKTNRAELASVYDRFPYDKGAAILLTLEGWLGSNVLQTGLRQYLTAHAYGSGTSSELAAALAAASHQNVRPVLDSMLDLTGVPVIEPHINCGKSIATIEQTRMPPRIIPVCWRSDDDESACTVLSGARTEIGLKSCPAWIVWNVGGTGYYRTRWTSIPPLDKLTAAERLTLVRDLRSFPSEDGRRTLEVLKSDAEPEVVKAASAN